VFNVTGGELVIILLVALIVLGPDKLPDAIRKVGRVYGELRRMSQGFQSEIRDALDEPMREVRDTMNTMKSGFSDLGADHPADPPPGTRMTATNGDATAPDGAGAAAEPPPAPPETTTAVAAGSTMAAAGEPGPSAGEPVPTAGAPVPTAGAPVPAAQEPPPAAVEPVPAPSAAVLSVDELAASPAEPSPAANGTPATHGEPAPTLEELASLPAEPSPPPANGTAVSPAQPVAPAQNEHP
jgi:sec-independent protein translocase protein TatB